MSNGKGKVTKMSEMNSLMFSKTLSSQHGLLRRNSFFKTQYFQKWHMYFLIFVRRILLVKITWNKSKIRKIWVLKKEFLLNQVGCGPKGLEEHHCVIAGILVTFPLAFDIFLQNPPRSKITNISEIYPHTEGHMCSGGNARGKINFPVWRSQGIVVSKNKGHPFPYFPWQKKRCI